MNTNKAIDWSQLWYPGPKRPFTPDEMARAGSDAPSPTLLAVLSFNLAFIAFMVLQLSPPSQTARITGLLAGLGVAGYSIGRWLWWNPWRRPLLLATVGLAAFFVLFSLGLRWRVPKEEERQSAKLLLAAACGVLPVMMWFLVMWRAQQIEGRLREQAEREKAIEMARRLAAAQIEPHFLFNTLASVQHWVQTKDDRAAPMLAALTGYLRATLPLFNRALLPASEELVAVQRYLEVMQARMGPRLRWRLDIAPGLEQTLLPPGLLLTLVENAVGHGIEPQLAGGEIVLSALREGEQATFTVSDTGPGPQPGMQEGVGLSNARQRLAMACGDTARLTLSPAPGGGCRASFSLPFKTTA